MTSKNRLIIILLFINSNFLPGHTYGTVQLPV